ncbi:MAG: hypothetical protein FWE12_00325 [Oscillospiraceae bacterium]|nr:hypothetical protein [Oscillospiraceae bacterium]
MKRVLQFGTLIFGFGIVATIFYFVVTGTMLIAVQSLLLSALMGMLIWDHLWMEKIGEPQPKKWLYFWMFAGVFMLAVGLSMLLWFPELAQFRYW